MQWMRMSLAAVQQRRNGRGRLFDGRGDFLSIAQAAQFDSPRFDFFGAGDGGDGYPFFVGINEYTAKTNWLF